MLAKAQRLVLEQLAAAHLKGDLEEAEIVAEGINAYIGLRRIAYRTVKALLDHLLISPSSEPSALFRRYRINSNGLAAVRRPELADELWLRVRTNSKPFSVVDDQIVDL